MQVRSLQVAPIANNPSNRNIIIFLIQSLPKLFPSFLSQPYNFFKWYTILTTITILLKDQLP